MGLVSGRCETDRLSSYQEAESDISCDFLSGSHLILIVDDDNYLGELYCDQLERSGYQVEWLSSGETALARIDRSPRPDAVLLGIKLGGSSGSKVMRLVLAEHPEIKIVLHSAYKDFMHDMVAWGADGYVEKSRDSRELLQTLRRVLDKTSPHMP